MQKAELLAPCGNFDCVKAAINNGADAIYLGGQLFNARAYATNFDNAELEKVCDLCHSYHVRVYVTVNTLYKDREFEQLAEFVDTLYAMGVDGLIMQDIGAIAFVRKMWPDLHVHASTQLTANNKEDVAFFEEMGLTTVVLSRELSLSEIREIAESSSLRIETFIHGALCVSYSGQCLMSSVLGNRSGNRGKCAQNCRLNYQLKDENKVIAKGHLLSTKDICTLELLPELLDSGVASLKIEGRMKSPEYVAGVTAIYRKYLDKYYNQEPYIVDSADVRELQQLFNRGFFSSGYLKTHSGLDMMCPVHPRSWGVPAGKVLSYDRNKKSATIRFFKDMVPGDGIEIWTNNEEGIGCYITKTCNPDQELTVSIEGPIQKDQKVFQTYDKRLMDALRKKYETIERKNDMDIHVSLKKNSPSQIQASANGCTVSLMGDIPSDALNQPLSEESVKAQFAKLGNTIYRLGDFSLEMEDNLYLNKSSLNALKNAAAETLTNAVISSYKREKKNAKPAQLPKIYAKEKSLSAYAESREQLNVLLSHENVKEIILPMKTDFIREIDAIALQAHTSGQKIYLKLPRVMRSFEEKEICGYFEDLSTASIDGFEISSVGHYHLIRSCSREIRLDVTGNILNSYSAAFYQELGCTKICASVEMSREEINAMSDSAAAEILAYGYLPLMITNQCPIGNFAGNKKNQRYCEKRYHSERYTLVSSQENFPLSTDCDSCLCTVFSSQPLDIRENIHSFTVGTIRLNFTLESAEETEKIVCIYEKMMKEPEISRSSKTNIYDKSVL